MKFHRQATVEPHAYTAAAEALYAALPPRAAGALYDYTEVGYRGLNEKLLRGGALNARETELCVMLDEALTSPPRPRTLYRGTVAWDPVPVGETFTAPQYLSTTSDPQQVFKFVNQVLPIVFEMNVVSGREVSLLRDEFEHLLPRGRRFIVEAIHEDVVWHAEYGTTGYTRSLEGATVVQVREVG
jgi:hypothetical protein